MRMCAHLLHKHIKNTATCGIILTENYQLVKGLLYNQNYKKDIQVIRKEIKAIGLDQWIQRKRETPRVTSTLGSDGSSHMLDIPVLESCAGKMSRLG